ncbi:MAG: DUF4268 domain-containing protein [Ferruginibacter sp.]
MYSKDEVSRMKSRFWTSFGQYMSPIPSASGEKINWVNYKATVKNIFFRMESGKKEAIISIELTHSDEQKRINSFEQFISVKKILEIYLDESWTWEQSSTDSNGKTVSRIYKSIRGVNLFNEQDWPAIISFFKPRLIKLDEFWNEYKEIFSLEE